MNQSEKEQPVNTTSELTLEGVKQLFLYVSRLGYVVNQEAKYTTGTTGLVTQVMIIYLFVHNSTTVKLGFKELFGHHKKVP